MKDGCLAAVHSDVVTALKELSILDDSRRISHHETTDASAYDN
jgi:hypothetical protein